MGERERELRDGKKGRNRMERKVFNLY